MILFDRLKTQREEIKIKFVDREKVEKGTCTTTNDCIIASLDYTLKRTKGM